mmetsp:Transcript_45266/g.114896  ORF Transcript_45266/g.114896 Transcript_45266/m.114896 type:complete len:206 (+) Transcript_45266:147-764(+)
MPEVGEQPTTSSTRLGEHPLDIRDGLVQVRFAGDALLIPQLLPIVFDEGLDGPEQGQEVIREEPLQQAQRDQPLRQGCGGLCEREDVAKTRFVFPGCEVQDQPDTSHPGDPPHWVWHVPTGEGLGIGGRAHVHDNHTRASVRDRGLRADRELAHGQDLQARRHQRRGVNEPAVGRVQLLRASDLPLALLAVRHPLLLVQVRLSVD